MKKLKHKILLTVLLLATLTVNAQPPTPPGGGGGTTPGAPATPIDMYVYFIAIIGIVFVTYFARKYKEQNI